MLNFQSVSNSPRYRPIAGLRRNHTRTIVKVTQENPQLRPEEAFSANDKDKEQDSSGFPQLYPAISAREEIKRRANTWWLKDSEVQGGTGLLYEH